MRDFLRRAQMRGTREMSLKTAMVVSGYVGTRPRVRSVFTMGTGDISLSLRLLVYGVCILQMMTIKRESSWLISFSFFYFFARFGLFNHEIHKIVYKIVFKFLQKIIFHREIYS